MAGLLNAFRAKYYIVFAQREKDLPFNITHLFTPPEWSHVYIVCKNGAGNTVMLNPALGGFAYLEYKYPLDDYLKLLIGESCKILEYDVVCDMNRFKMRYLYSCVELVKSMCGIQRFNILTPKQLYRYLIKRGASEYDGSTKAKGAIG